MKFSEICAEVLVPKFTRAEVRLPGFWFGLFIILAVENRVFNCRQQSIVRDRHVQNHGYFKVNFPSLESVVYWCFSMNFRKIASKKFFYDFSRDKNDFFRKISRKSTF